MRLAWVSHREWSQHAGGAEAADFEMIARRPDQVSEVVLISPGGVAPDLREFDRVVVTGWYGFNDRELNMLGDLEPIIWVHDTQFPGHWLLETARTVILLTPQHKEFEMDKTPLLREDRIVLNPGFMSLEGIEYSSEHDSSVALWAHRPDPYKGLDKAVKWATNKGLRLEVMVGRPRQEVLAAMRRCGYFVLMSYLFDPGPRSVIEAQLSGCTLATDSVGFWDEPLDALAARVTNADKDFWSVVLDG